MATTRLSLYNGALLECRQRPLATLSEEGKARRLLDQVWAEGAVEACLAAEEWRFATRTIEAVPSADLTPSFGYAFAYSYPEDHQRTRGVYSDEYAESPHTSYRVEANVLYTDLDPIYWSYVSSDAAYGGDLSLWPHDFVLYVQTYLASRIVGALTGDDTLEKKVFQLAEHRRLAAANSDAMEEATQRLPAGSWVRARARFGRTRDRGPRGRLIG